MAGLFPLSLAVLAKQIGTVSGLMIAAFPF